jgi:hypothetical protein
MTRRIKLTRYAANTVDFNNYGAYRIRIEVTDFEGPDLDSYIFIYKRNPPSAYTTQSCDTFEAVAGPPQLALYPAGEPNPDQGWPYYRLNYVELDLASTEQADQIWNEIQEQVCVLVAAMNRFDNLQAVEDKWCPAAPPSGSASSASI